MRSQLSPSPRLHEPCCHATRLHAPVREFLAPLANFYVGLDRPIMERAEPFIPRQLRRTVIAFKIPVVHLVVESTQLQSVLVLDQHPFEPGVSRGCR